jgi:hypothetical protein
MATSLIHVQRGDLITADLLNSIMDQLLSQDSRISALEFGSAPGAVQIIALTPANGNVQLGAELRVAGKNFGFVAGATVVYVDTTRIQTFKTGSNDQLLIFDVPATLTNVPSTGRPAALTVSNQTTSAQAQLTVFSSMQVQGNIDVNWQPLTPVTPQSNTPATFSNIVLRSRANIPASFQISATVDQPTWKNNVQVLDSSGNQVGPAGIPIQPNQQTTISVLINPIPAGSNGVPFSLVITATAGTVVGSTTISGTVGQPITLPDTTINAGFSSGNAIPANSGSADAVKGVVMKTASVGTGAGVLLTYSVDSTAATYNITLALVGGATNWTLALVDPQPTVGNPLAGSFSLAPGNLSRFVEFSVVPQAGATTPAALTMTIQRQGANNSRVITLPLSVQ